MKKIYKRILIIALLLILMLIFNILFGNPISAHRAEKMAQTYLLEQYPDQSLFVEKVKRNFKTGRYDAQIRSETSQDTDFTLGYSPRGILEFDSYLSEVASGANTADRLDLQYRTLADTVFKSLSFPYEAHVAFGCLEFVSEENAETPDTPSYALVMEKLILDKDYDIRELGAQAGVIQLTVRNHEVTPQIASEMLLTVRKLFDEANVPFRCIRFGLWPQKNAKEAGTSAIDLSIDYEALTQEGIAAALAQNK